MRRAQKEIDRGKVKLLKERDVVVKLPMQYCKHHMDFDEHLQARGYPEIAELEASLKADYDVFLEPLRLRRQSSPSHH